MSRLDEDTSLAGSLSSLAGQLEAAKEVGAAANQLLLSAGGHPVDVSKFEIKLTCLFMVFNHLMLFYANMYVHLFLRLRLVITVVTFLLFNTLFVCRT